jgi:hypothetical protein
MKTKKNLPRWIPLALLLCALTSWCQAQETDTIPIYKVEMQDGNVFIGPLVERTMEVVRLQTDYLGVIAIPVRQIAEMEEIDPVTIVEGELWERTPLGARYFYAPNGYGLKKGEAYYQNVWVLFNQVSYGITDYFTLGIGTVPLFLFNGIETPVWVTPKFSIPLVEDKVQLGVGGLVGVLASNDLIDFGILYASATVGPRDRNFSVGVGLGYLDGELAQRPTLNIAGQIRVSQKTFLVSENYLISDGFNAIGILSFGGRTVWDKISLDYGLAFPVAEFGGFIGVPWLGVGLPFGKAK